MRKRSTRRAFAWYVVLRGRSPPPAPPGPEVLLLCWFLWTILLLFFFWLTLLLLFFWRVLLGLFARQRLPRPRRVRSAPVRSGADAGRARAPQVDGTPP